MKIILCTSTFYKDKQPEYIYYTDNIKLKYCQKWHWQYIRSYDLNYPDLHPVWDKLPLIKKCLSYGADWVIWMDADACPCGLNKDISSYLQHEQKKIIILKDYLNFNAGVFAVPNTQRALQWINYIDSKRNDPKYDHGWRQQQAMIDSFKENYSDFYKFPPKDIGFNNYYNIYNRKLGTYDPNQFIYEQSWCLHIPNKSDELRLYKFKNIYNKLNNIQINNKINFNDGMIVANQNENIYDKLNKLIIKDNKINSNIGIIVVTNNEDVNLLINKNTNIIQIDTKNISKKYQDVFYSYCGKMLYFSQEYKYNKDYIGCVQNRRFFKGLIKNYQRNYEQILKNNDIILAKPFFEKSILQQHINGDLMRFLKKDGFTIEDVIKEYNKILTSSEFNYMINTNRVSFHDIFITRKEIFYNYCNYLKYKLDIYKNSNIMQVYLKNYNYKFGDWFAERLLNTYCYINHLKIYEQQIVTTSK